MSIGNTTLYAGNYVYEGPSGNEVLKFFNTYEGYVEPSGTAFDYVYQYKDHLGNIRLSYSDKNNDGDIDISTDPNIMEIVEENNYYPFGLKHKGYNSNVVTSEHKWKYNGKELQDELDLNWYDLGARNLDHALGRFMNVDPRAEDYNFQSVYAFANNNPVLFVDINGEGVDSTIVTENEDGTHTVVGGDANDGDNNIYVATKNEKGEYVKTGETIGESVTSHTFFDENDNAVVGAIIDTNSTEGQDFIDDLAETDPSLTDYMWNGTTGEKYDFKADGIEEAEGTSEQHRYRGSVTTDGKIGSARDFGNMGAGLVAGRKGIPRTFARAVFDALESYQTSSLKTEGIPTQNAQKVGFKKGKSIYTRSISTKGKTPSSIGRFGEN